MNRKHALVNDSLTMNQTGIQQRIAAFRQILLERSRPLVMGILNVTPDSFSDGGLHLPFESAVLSARTMMQQGADIIDIGGESTRPGADKVSVEDELARVLPVVQACYQQGIPVSVDTSKAEVMQACLEIGVVMLNDINGFRGPGVTQVLSHHTDYQPMLCIMHMQGTPQTMQLQPEYQTLEGELNSFFRERIAALTALGINPDQLILDPGFGFGKTDEHNWQLLAGLKNFTALKCPLLAGLSRKSMFGRLLDRKTGERLASSLAGAMIAADQGARIIRVHDVAETVDVLRVWDRVKSV